MIPVLVDTSVLNHALAVRGEWQSIGPRKWGNFEFEAGGIVSARRDIPIRLRKGGAQAAAIGALRNEFNAKRLSYHSTDALLIERLVLKLGANYGDVNLFGDVVCDVRHQTLPELVFSLPDDDPMHLLRLCLEGMRCEPYSTYLAALQRAGASTGKVTQDAWHLHSAQTCGSRYFLTCDTSLKGMVASISDKSLRGTLQKLVKLPTELCAELGIEVLSREAFDELMSQLDARPHFVSSGEP